MARLHTPWLHRPSRALRGLALSLAVASCASAGAGGVAGRGIVAATPTYTSRTDTPWTPPANHADLYAAAAAGGTSAGHELAADPALAATAQALAERVAADRGHRTPPASVLQTLAWAAGVIDPLPAVVVTMLTGTPALDPLTTSVADAARDGGFNRMGIGRASTGDNSAVIVVALSQRRATLQLPVPRRVASGARVVVNGRLVDGLRNPELAITHPDGRSEHFPLGDGPAFVGQFPVAMRGAYQIELLAENEGGATVIANFPVYVDVDPSATPEPAAASATDATETVAQVSTALFQLANDARRAAGRHPLELMPTISAVAQAHSDDMAAHHFIAHNSRTSGTPSDRLRHAGLTSGLILENIGRGYSAREIHDGLMASPGHRANLLNDRVTHVGLGVTRETGPSGGFVVTENYIEVAAPVDLATAPARVLELLNSARTRRGATAVAVRPQLAEIAGNAARAFFQGNPAQQSVVDRANREAARFGLIFRRVAVLATVVSRLEDAGALEPLFEPGIGAVGVGVAQGTRPDAPPGALFVVFVLGYLR